MFIVERVMDFLNSTIGGKRRASKTRKKDVQMAALIQAQGDVLALIATFLERERVASVEELGCSLSDFAKTAAEERPEEAQLLTLWARHLLDAAVSLKDGVRST